MQRRPGSRGAARWSRRAPRPGRVPGAAATRSPGASPKPRLEEPARLCREAAGDASPSADLGRFQSAGHLDSPNLLCGRYRCSPGLTSLSESADHSERSTTETSSPCPSGVSIFLVHLCLGRQKDKLLMRQATRASAGGGHRLAGNRLQHQVLGRSGEKAAWMDRASKGSATPAWDGEEGD
ncbi:hypothetical protein R6Z07F_002685 [Ovis aries]